MNSTGKLALLGCAALVAACSDTVAPRSASGGGPAMDAPETGAAMSREGLKKPLTKADTDRFSITIDPSSKTSYVLGTGNVLTFPAGSVCDPARSSYGEGQSVSYTHLRAH